MSFDKAYYGLGRLDRLSYMDTYVHRLDARVKVIVTMLFIIVVISYPKYEVIELAPLFLFPALMISLGDLPVLFLLKKILVVSPFAVFIGIFNPLFDPGTVVFFGMKLSAGWLSFLSILVKFTLTISAALILIATTSFPGVCHALGRLKVPALFVSQLLFLYRYLFVLAEETMRMVRVRDMRSFGKRGMQANVVARIIGALFLRTVERAERIYRAMLSRGFRGEIPVLRRHSLTQGDALFLFLTIGCLAVFRLFPFAELTGRFAREILK
jgi:cobalt/nickel transport system permease protein